MSARSDLIEGHQYVVIGNENSHYYAIGSTVTFLRFDHDGDAEFTGPDPQLGGRLTQYLRPVDVRPRTAEDGGALNGLTTTQLSALVELGRQGSLRPSGRAFGGPNGARSFRRSTLQALVDAGHAEWRKSVRGTRNGPRSYDGFITAKA